MNNILAIAHKELKSYFATPIAYVVIGFFALLFGYFFYAMLIIFDQQSMQIGGLEGGGNVDINEQLIRPLFLNASVILLFVLPLITMRTYSEEKRSGTIELLLTSPMTDFEIIIGKFLGAMALYAAMLAITLIHMGLLFSFGNPEWKVGRHRLPRAAADGRLLHLGRPAHLEPDEEPDRRGHGDLRGVPAAVGRSTGSRRSPVRRRRAS